MTTSIRRTAALVAVAALGCAAPRPPVIAPTTVAGECALPGGGRATADTLLVALPGAIDPAHAPLPEGDAERFLFRALYETLIHVDCTGRSIPALAQAWTPEDGGRRWTFVLRQDARFWDGEPVTAHDVVAAWTAHDTLGALAPWDGPVGQAAQVMSDRVLAVRLRRPSPTVPLALAHPGLAITKRAPGLAWPIGTGRYWISGSAPDVTLAPAFGDPLPAVRIRPLRGGDARDALDAGADVLVTDDPAVLAYAATRSDLNATPLPWDRTYVLVPAGGAAQTNPGPVAPDAVRVEARAPDGTPWWRTGATCAPPPRPVTDRTTARGPRRIAYPRGDAVARDVANRLVALAGGGMAASAVAPDALTGELRSPRSVAYVLALPRGALDPCFAVEQLVARMPWLVPATMASLLDVRRRVVLRGRRPSLSFEWDGTLRVEPR